MKTSRRRTSLIPLAGILAALAFAPAAHAAVAGDLDKLFSGDGRLATDFQSMNSASVFDSAVDSSGRLVVVGADGGEIGVARFNPDGSFDDTFAGDGDITIDSGATTGGERARSVAIDLATGNILVVGDASISASGDTSDIVVARILPGGTLDSTFDGPGTPGNGRFRLDFDDNEFGKDILAIESGKAVFTADLGAGTTGRVRVAQLTSTGALDTAVFGNPNGFFDFQWAANTHSFAQGFTRQDDGKLLVSGSINGTATYAVARITTAGALDTTFNNSGTIPGIARPTLPAGYISTRAFEVVADANGVTVVGDAHRVTPVSDREPMISRLTSAGVLDTTFGSSSGYTIVSLTTTSDEALNGIASLAGGTLFAGGTSGEPGANTQLAARFTSTGALDSGFSGDGVLETGHPGLASVTGLASPVSPSGVGYLTGLGEGSVIAVSAVCVTVPPACPVPETPINLTVAPTSGANDNGPRIRGLVPAGEAPNGVTIYKDAACTGPMAGTGSQATFEASGIQVSVPDNSTTTFYAKANGAHGDSGCSAGVAYSEVTPPTPVQAAKKKKCKKAKKKAASAKKKCKKKRK